MQGAVHRTGSVGLDQEVGRRVLFGNGGDCRGETFVELIIKEEVIEERGVDGGDAIAGFEEAIVGFVIGVAGEASQVDLRTFGCGLVCIG